MIRYGIGGGDFPPQAYKMLNIVLVNFFCTDNEQRIHCEERYLLREHRQGAQPREQRAAPLRVQRRLYVGAGASDGPLGPNRGRLHHSRGQTHRGHDRLYHRRRNGKQG